MKVIKTLPKMREWSQTQKKNDELIGFVPTMGYLHQGHVSLIREAKKNCRKIVVSIYVNPTQFAPGEDLNNYPRNFEKDESLCREEAVDVVFYPSNNEMYAKDHSTWVVNDDLSRILCGQSRPTHFRGVSTIVSKLFNIIQPNIAVFGQKDAQQALIIQKMVQDLNYDIRIIVAPILREDDGLAMSSRNKYLSSMQRKEAIVLHESLKMAEREYNDGNSDYKQIKGLMRNHIEQNSSARIDYIEFSNAVSLELADASTAEVIVALAAYFGKTRLIDNIILRQKGRK